MSKRVLALVQRSGNGANVTDRTPTSVWEHEVPILEEIHGEGSVTVIEDPDDILDKGIVADRKQHIDYIIKCAQLGEEFSGDPSEEYQRLVIKYGQHSEVKMSNVEKVYGSFREGAFKRAVMGSGNSGSAKDDLAQLRATCDELGIDYKPTDKRDKLMALIRAAKEEQKLAA